MPSTTEITVSQLSRLIGLPHSPAIIDVRTDEEFASDPRLIPGSQRRTPETYAQWEENAAANQQSWCADKDCISARAPAP